MPVKRAELAIPAALCSTATSESSHRHGEPLELGKCNNVLRCDTGVRPFDPRALVVVVVVVVVLESAFNNASMSTSSEN